MARFSKWTFCLISSFCGLAFITSVPVCALGLPITLIETQTVTNKSAVTFTGVTSLFNNYSIIGTNITNPSFNGNFFGIQISTDEGKTYINTGYSSQFTPLTLIGVFNPTSTSNTSFELLIMNLTSGHGNIGACGTGVVYNPSVPGCDAFNSGGGYMVPNTVANSLQLVADDGSKFSGTFSLYGYTGL